MTTEGLKEHIGEHDEHSAEEPEEELAEEPAEQTHEESRLPEQTTVSATGSNQAPPESRNEVATEATIIRKAEEGRSTPQASSVPLSASVPQSRPELAITSGLWNHLDAGNSRSQTAQSLARSPVQPSPVGATGDSLQEAGPSNSSSRTGSRNTTSAPSLDSWGDFDFGQAEWEGKLEKESRQNPGSTSRASRLLGTNYGEPAQTGSQCNPTRGAGTVSQGQINPVQTKTPVSRADIRDQINRAYVRRMDAIHALEGRKERERAGLESQSRDTTTLQAQHGQILEFIRKDNHPRRQVDVASALSSNPFIDEVPDTEEALMTSLASDPPTLNALVETRGFENYRYDRQSSERRPEAERSSENQSVQGRTSHESLPQVGSPQTPERELLPAEQRQEYCGISVQSDHSTHQIQCLECRERAAVLAMSEVTVAHLVRTFRASVARDEPPPRWSLRAYEIHWERRGFVPNTLGPPQAGLTTGQAGPNSQRKLSSESGQEETPPIPPCSQLRLGPGQNFNIFEHWNLSARHPRPLEVFPQLGRPPTGGTTNLSESPPPTPRGMGVSPVNRQSDLPQKTYSISGTVGRTSATRLGLRADPISSTPRTPGTLPTLTAIRSEDPFGEGGDREEEWSTGSEIEVEAPL